MTNLLEQAISTNDCNRAAKLIQNALGIESNEVANYCFPKTLGGRAGTPGGTSFFGEPAGMVTAIL
jgi:hypothetical protein